MAYNIRQLNKIVFKAKRLANPMEARILFGLLTYWPHLDDVKFNLDHLAARLCLNPDLLRSQLGSMRQKFDAPSLHALVSWWLANDGDADEETIMLVRNRTGTDVWPASFKLPPLGSHTVGRTRG